MRSIVVLCLFTVIFGVSAFAQKAKTGGSDLPADITDWVGQDSDRILENPSVKMRLKSLLGENDYESFSESFETQTPIVKSGDFFFVSGCMVHACTRLESAVAIDPVNDTVHAAIYNETENTKYFNENSSETPEPIIKWATRLEDQKKDDDTGKKPDAMLIDGFRYGNSEEMMLRIDNYVVELQNDPSAKAYIIISGEKKARNAAEMKIKPYLKLRGLAAERIVFLYGKGDREAEIELWFVPTGAEPPAPKSAIDEGSKN